MTEEVVYRCNACGFACYVVDCHHGEPPTRCPYSAKKDKSAAAAWVAFRELELGLKDDEEEEVVS